MSSPSSVPVVSRSRLVPLLSVAALLYALDVVTKVLAVARLEDEPPIRLLGGGLYLVLVHNPGAAFGIGTGYTWVISLIMIAVIVAVLVAARSVRSTGWAVGLGLVLGGALGNLTDRLVREPGPLRGRVVDFLSVFADDGSVWPVFNVADMAVVSGGALLVLFTVLGRDHDGSTRASRAAAETETGDQAATRKESGERG